MDEKTALTYAIARAIAYTENAGNVDIDNPRAGKTGEMKSIYQFTPATWKNYAKEVLKDENAPINAENETKVVTAKVRGWIDKGYDARQIASMWNAGTGEPDAHTGKFSNGNPSKGINKKYGVKFDVPSYADKVQNYSKDFYVNKYAKEITPQKPVESPKEKGFIRKAVDAVTSSGDLHYKRAPAPTPKTQGSDPTHSILLSLAGVQK